MPQSKADYDSISGLNYTNLSKHTWFENMFMILHYLNID